MNLIIEKAIKTERGRSADGARTEPVRSFSPRSPDVQLVGLLLAVAVAWLARRIMHAQRWYISWLRLGLGPQAQQRATRQDVERTWKQPGSNHPRLHTPSHVEGTPGRRSKRANMARWLSIHKFRRQSRQLPHVDVEASVDRSRTHFQAPVWHKSRTWIQTDCLVPDPLTSSSCLGVVHRQNSRVKSNCDAVKASVLETMTSRSVVTSMDRESTPFLSSIDSMSQLHASAPCTDFSELPQNQPSESRKMRRESVRARPRDVGPYQLMRPPMALGDPRVVFVRSRKSGQMTGTLMTMTVTNVSRATQWIETTRSWMAFSPRMPRSRAQMMMKKDDDSKRARVAFLRNGSLASRMIVIGMKTRPISLAMLRIMSVMSDEEACMHWSPTYGSIPQLRWTGVQRQNWQCESTSLGAVLATYDLNHHRYP
ncbi:hypothetical protein BC567DRAFT_239820 [Phyllosticta citribraziliensis]